MSHRWNHTRKVQCTNGALCIKKRGEHITMWIAGRKDDHPAIAATNIDISHIDEIIKLLSEVKDAVIRHHPDLVPHLVPSDRPALVGNVVKRLMLKANHR